MKHEDFCSGKYQLSDKHIAVPMNPNGEFVKGYGYSPVTKMSTVKVMICPICLHEEGTLIIKEDK